MIIYNVEHRTKSSSYQEISDNKLCNVLSLDEEEDKGSNDFCDSHHQEVNKYITGEVFYIVANEVIVEGGVNPDC